MKCKILIDNYVRQTQVVAEHGLSIYIEDDERRMLFDVGASDAIVRNARVGHVDLSAIDTVILSHGHSDHSGGIECLMSANERFRLVAGSGYDVRRTGTHGTEIGFPSAVTLARERVEIVKAAMQISSHVWVHAYTDVEHDLLGHTEGFHLVCADGSKRRDTFADELYMSVVYGGKLTVISGCSHHGIASMAQAASAFHGMRVNRIVGGLHTVRDSETQVSALATALTKLGVDELICCHCTGIDAYAQLRHEMNEATVTLGCVGMNISF